MFRSFDAAYPPVQAYPGTTAVLGYLGGRPFPDRTPHVWTPAEWRRFAHLHQAGIWLYDPGHDPAAVGREAAMAAEGLGWTATDGGFDVVVYGSASFVHGNNAGPAAPASSRRFIILDMETWINMPWVRAFIAAAGGARPGFAGYWVAEWDGVADEIPGTVAHQWRPDVPWESTQVDLSVWDQPMWGKFGVGPRKG